MKTCPKCGFKNYDIAKSCFECGEKFSATQAGEKTICPNCNRQISAGAFYCNYCGHDLIPTTARQTEQTGDEVERKIKVRYCLKCGTYSPEDSWYCRKCGETLSLDTTTELSVDDQYAKELIENYSGVITCPNCNYEYHMETINCPKCGTRSPTYQGLTGKTPTHSVRYKTCPYCGEEIFKDASTCYHCGRKINKTKEISTNGKKKGFCNCSSCLTIAVIAFVIVSIPLNPSKTDHNIGICSHIIKQFVLGLIPQSQVPTDIQTKLISEIVLHEVCSEYGWFSLPGVNYSSYIFFSTSTIHNKVISVGFLKYVAVVTPVSDWGLDVLDEALKLAEKIMLILETATFPLIRV